MTYVILSIGLALLTDNRKSAWTCYEIAWKLLHRSYNDDPSFHEISLNLCREICFFLSMTEQDWIETCQCFLDELPSDLRQHENACKELHQHIQEMINEKELNAVRHALQIEYESEEEEENHDGDQLEDDQYDDYGNVNDLDYRRNYSHDNVLNNLHPTSDQPRQYHQVNSYCFKCCDTILSTCCFGCALFCFIIAGFLTYYKATIFAYMEAYTDLISAVIYNYFGISFSLIACKTVYYFVTISFFLFSAIELGRFLLSFCRAKIIEYRRVDSDNMNVSDIEGSSTANPMRFKHDIVPKKHRLKYNRQPDTPSTLESTLTPDDVVDVGAGKKKKNRSNSGGKQSSLFVEIPSSQNNRRIRSIGSS